MADAIRVNGADPAKKTSEILGPSSDEATVQMSELAERCYWNDIEYQQGVRIIDGEDCYECSFGKWVLLDD